MGSQIHGKLIDLREYFLITQEINRELALCAAEDVRRARGGLFERLSGHGARAAAYHAAAGLGIWLRLLKPFSSER